MDVKQVMGFLGEIAKLMHQRHLSFMERVVERGESYLITGMGESCPENLKAQFVKLRGAQTNEDNAFKSQRGSDYTAMIEAADTARDTTLSGVNAMLDALGKIGSEEQKAAVPKIRKVFDLYKIKPSDSYEDEGIKLAQLCQECEQNLQVSEALATCGLTAQITLLKQQNAECRRLVNLRNEERSQTDSQAMNKARKETDAAYADFILLLNAYNVVNFQGGHSTFDELIGTLNADIDYYRTWVLKKSGSSDDGGGGGSDDGGSDDGGGDTPTPTPTPDPTPDPTPEPTPDPAPSGGGDE